MKAKKQTFAIMLILIISIGVSGCMGSQKKYVEINEKTQLAMMDYLGEKYDQPFTEVEFIPAWRGFNDSMNESILVVKSAEGFLVNVREFVHSPGKFRDNFLDVYATKLANSYVDFNGIDSLIAGTMHVKVKVDMTYDELNNGTFAFTSEYISYIDCYIFVNKAEITDVSELYNVYNQMQDIGFENYAFYVAYTNNLKESKMFTENYDLNGGFSSWSAYDKSDLKLRGVITSKLVQIDKAELSFYEFQQYFQ